jgi:hypothetical protein
VGGWWPWFICASLFLVPREYTDRFVNGWSALLAYPRLYGVWWLWALAIAETVHDGREPIRRTRAA